MQGKAFLKRSDFNQLAEVYKRYRRGYNFKVYKKILNTVPSKTSRVLDLGCGTGISTQFLSKYYKHVYGVDKGEEMIKIAKNDFKRLGLKAIFKASSSDNLPFENNYFDLITIAQAFHWMVRDNNKSIKEIKRVLKNNGYLIVYYKRGLTSGYLPDYIRKIMYKYTRFYPGKTIKGVPFDKFLESNGFGIESFEAFDTPEKYTINSFLGFIKSHSTINLISEEKKEAYLDEVKKVVSKHLLNGYYYLNLKTDIIIAKLK